VRDRLVSEKEDPGKVSSMASLREEIRRSMDKLTMREAQILELRFGLVDGHPQTLEEIGKWVVVPSAPHWGLLRGVACIAV
jgi:DNA-directed RNA polymerase sigma subunit (sigma70/sigma32)